MADMFIQEATAEHKGTLRRYAAKHRLLTKKGTIDLPRAKGYVERNESGAMKTKRLREINLAMTLKRLRA